MLFLFMGISTFLFCSKIVSSEEENRSVLFISSYHEKFETVPEQVKGIQSVLKPLGISLDIEYMDMRRFNTDENRENFYKSLTYKLNRLPYYDGILVGDDDALQFAMDYRDTVFSNIPIVFFGINDFGRAEAATKLESITGMVEKISLEDNIKLAQTINKNATKVTAIIDNTLTGIGDKHSFYAIQNKFPELTFDTVNTSEYTLGGLKDKIESMEGDTILLYLSMFEDKTGENYTISQAVEILSSYAKIPIYRASFGGVGSGLLGGNMVSYEETGKMASEMLLDIMNGGPIASVSVIEESANRYIFDYEVMEKYHIDEDILPKDSIFINKKLSFYEQYRELVIIVCIILSMLILFSIVLMIDNLKRRSVERALKESHERLSQTYEELAATEEELRTQYAATRAHVEKTEVLNQKYEIAINSTNSAVWELDLTSKVVYLSKSLSHILNQPIQEYEEINLLLERVLTPEASENLMQEYNSYNRGEKNEISIQLPVRDDNDDLKWILIRGRVVKDSNGCSNLIHGIILDITKMKEQEEIIQHLAHHDYLTKLPNRASFMERLKEEMNGSRPGAILLLDIDNFKGINDTLGHTYGDLILKGVADRMTSISTNKIFVSRFGGDEFLVLICNEEGEEVIESYIRMITKVLEEPFVIFNKENIIQCSIGVSRFPRDSMDANELIMNADTAMYRVKFSGKNNFLFYENEMKVELEDKIKIETHLRHALKHNGFRLVYQPQVSILTGKIIGFEALLRLKDSNLPPNKFIGIAEETGLIIDIGRWVTNEAISQLLKWKEAGLEPKVVSINFSSQQTRDLGYFEFLKETLRDYNINPGYLEIEITESILLEKTEKTMVFLNQLKELGVRIALDDFGTGFSSINYLTYIPVNKVKLDKSLCDKFLQLENMKVMDSIISLAHSLNLEITAEGIEKKDQYYRLKKGGCDYIQGYLFCKPLSVEEIEMVYDKKYVEP